MKNDIEIAQSASMEKITNIAEKIGLTEDDIDLYGKYKCKINLEVLEKRKERPDGKLILVTAINPTPAGEGKSTVTVGLGQALCKLGKNAIIALREPSLGPVFGVKGGAAGGGYSQVVPMEDINLHLPGTFMLSPQLTIYCVQQLITISIKETPWILMLDELPLKG